MSDPDRFRTEGFAALPDLFVKSGGPVFFGSALVLAIAVFLLASRRSKEFDAWFPLLPGLTILLPWNGLNHVFPGFAPMVLYVVPGIVFLSVGWFFVSGPVRKLVSVATPRIGTAGILAATLFVVYAGMGFRLLATKGFGSGDEIHYLTQAKSLWLDHDLNLADNIDAPFSFDVETFEKYHLSLASRQGEAHSNHPFGLSLLMVPGYALGREWGSTLVLVLIGVLYGMVLYRILLRETAETTVSVRVALTFTVFSPFLVFAVRGYPEMAAGLGYLFVYERLTSEREPGRNSYFLAGLCLGFLPWLLIRRCYLPWLGLNAVGAWGLLRKKDPGRIAAFVVPQAGLIGLLLWINHHRFSGNDLFPEYAAGLVTGGREGIYPTVKRMTRWRIWHPDGLLGLWIDRRFGLVWSNPFLVFAFPVALLGAFRCWRKDLGWLLIFLGMYVLTSATVLADWTGGAASHPGRYMVAVFPFLAIPLARFLAGRSALWVAGGIQVSVLCAVLAGIALFAGSWWFECPYYAYTKLAPRIHGIAESLPWFRSWFQYREVNPLQMATMTGSVLFLSWLSFGRFAPRISKSAFTLILLGILLLGALVR